jgi:hypothetical protein
MTRFRTLPYVFTLALVAPLAAQTPQTATTRQAAPATGAPAAPATLPSAILRPAMQSVQQALELARPEKWKAPSAITAESATDIGSIQRDLNQTLPPLVTASDANPNSVTNLLPAYRNIEALYDVVVRVTQTAVLTAPSQQSTAFQQATQSLQQARRDFGDLLTTSAQSQDRRVHDAQTRLASLQSAPPPPAPVCPTPPPTKKTTPKRRSTAAAKPATP